MRLLTFAALCATTALPAFAQTAPSAIALVDERTLVTIDTSSGAVLSKVDVEGVVRLLGIDVRPSNGMLYGVTDAQGIVTIDVKTGVATDVAMIAAPLPLADTPVVVDFNPAADRLRYMTGTANHRIHPDTGETTVDGTLAFEAGGENAAAEPAIVAAAYTNSHGKPEKTAMFNIDAGMSGLVQQTVPNDGTLAAIGPLGVEWDGTVGFDVGTTPDGTNTAWLAANGALHQVNLETGVVSASTPIPDVAGAVRDLAILPSM